ncbi:MAG: HD-GYP domain-containing protein [Eubacteriales bacterium]|jgi:putative nucleotidyltransferase with HDIG domain
MNSSYGSQNNSISGFQKVVSVPIDDVRPGMVCAQSIEDRLGRHLVNSGAVLNQYVIDRLKVFGILYLDIRFSGPNRTAVPKRSISPEVRETIQRERRPDRPKVRLDRQIKTQIEKGMELIYTDSRPDVLVGVSSKISDDLMNAIGKNDAVALNLVELKTSDEYTFNHSVDVATIAMVIAKNMHYPLEKIREIGVAGILHDVGKSKVPIEILNKPARLTNDEFEVIKKHSQYSFDMIKDVPELSDEIKKGVLEHHEKINGRGYPNGLTEDEIEPYAKILTVADIYDALCTTRPYKKGYTPRESVEMLAAMTDQLDIDVLNVFFSSMVLYPVDSTVRLSNGEEARVVRSNDELITRPVVVGMKSGKVYDLSSTDYLNLVIAS